jgi:hypothetical protein
MASGDQIGKSPYFEEKFPVKEFRISSSSSFIGLVILSKKGVWCDFLSTNFLQNQTP